MLDKYRYKEYFQFHATRTTLFWSGFHAGQPLIVPANHAERTAQPFGVGAASHCTGWSNTRGPLGEMLGGFRASLIHGIVASFFRMAFWM